MKQFFGKTVKNVGKKQRFRDHINCNKRNLFGGRSKRFSEYLLAIEMKKDVMNKPFYSVSVFIMFFIYVFIICVKLA